MEVCRWSSIKIRHSLRWRLLFATPILVLLMASAAEAHDGAIYASTPVTPPWNWLWLPPLFILASVLWDWFVLRKTAPFSRLITAETLGFSRFLIIIVLIGFNLYLVYMFINFPLPLFGPPGQPFRGLPRRDTVVLFVVVNVLMLIFYLRMKLRLFDKLPPLEVPFRRTLMLGSAAMYLLFLIPYVLTNSMTHGWTGRPESTRCMAHLMAVGRALVEYAAENEGRLPNARTFHDVRITIDPYLRSQENPSLEPIEICPAEKMFNKPPREYSWNASFAGAKLEDSPDLPETAVIISCPVDHRPLYFHDLFRVQKDISEEDKG